MIDVRVVYPPPLRARPAVIDGEALGAKACARDAWQYLMTHGGGARKVQPTEPRQPHGYQSKDALAASPDPYNTMCTVAIASPTGQVAVWYGAMPATDFQLEKVAFHAIWRPSDGILRAAFVGNVAQTWNSANLKPRRTVAQAACRVLHAEVFAYEPTERDKLLVELWALDPVRLLEAPLETLQACAALRAIGNERGASAILAGLPAFNFPTPIERP